MTMTHTAENAKPARLNRDEVIDEIRKQLVAELGTDAGQVGPDTVLRELPGADSVRLLRVVATIERHYDVEFDDEDVFGVSTASELATLVIRLLEDGQ
jgi:acyl carrier protein